MVIQDDSSFRVPNFVQTLRHWWAYNPLLTGLAVAMVITTVLGFVGIALDPRLVTNAPVWAKTTKFSISVTLYAATFLWMLPFLTARPRLAQWVANGIGLTLAIEMALIILQGIRGQAMHFNYSTPLDGTLYGIMSVTIVVLWVVSMVGAFLLVRQKMADPALAWGIRLGAIIMVVGMGLGFLMTSPNEAQMAEMQSGAFSGFIGAHTVGAPDGGEGLPLLGWSTTHGDLRIAHFIGLHAFQVIPLIGWWLGQRRGARLSTKQQVGLVWVSGGSYLAITLLAAWQALRGQPLIAPDGLTLATFFAILIVTVVAKVGIILSGRPATPAPASA